MLRVIGTHDVLLRGLSGNVRGLSGNLSDLAVAFSQYDILLCSETLISDLCHMSELLVPGFPYGKLESGSP